MANHPTAKAELPPDATQRAAPSLLVRTLHDALDGIFDAFDRAPDGSLRALMDAADVKDMVGANLAGADMRGEDLSGIDFEGADLSRADLRGANLSGCYLRNAVMEGAKVYGANFTGAQLDKGALDQADDRAVSGLGPTIAAALTLGLLLWRRERRNTAQARDEAGFAGETAPEAAPVQVDPQPLQIARDRSRSY